MSADLPFALEPTWKQHLCYEALKNPVLDDDGDRMTVEVFFGGGAGGGKSWSICESRLVNAYKYPGYKSFIGRNELKRLMQSTFVTWGKVCRYHNIPRDEWRLDGQMHVIRFTNGSTIDLLDLKYLPAEDPLYERYGSTEYSDGAIEEAGEVHPLAREVMRTRVNRHLNDELDINPSLLETGNPKKNWTYHAFYKPHKAGELPKNMIFIQSLWKDNPHTARSYGKTLSGIKDPVMRARLRDGNWEYEDDPSALLEYAAIADLFTNHIPDDEDDEEASDRYMTVDVARYGADKTVIALWRGWVCYKLLWREKQGTDETEAWIKEVAYENEVPYSHIAVDEDGIGGGVVDHVKGVRGFLANSTPIEQEEEEDDDEDNKPEQKKAFANLKTQCAYVLANKVNYHRAGVRCESEQIRQWLTEELEQIKEENIDADEKRRLVPKEEVKIVLGRSPDFGDTFIMRAIFELKPPKKEKQTWSYRHKAQRGR